MFSNLNFDDKYRGYVVTDVDGCLTNGKVYYDSSGYISREFSVIDGHGVKLLRDNGFTVVVISGENDYCTRARANKLGVRFVGGVKDKRELLKRMIMSTFACSVDDVYYLGDDYPDLDVLDIVGYFATPKNSLLHKRLKNENEKIHVLESEGGQGAFRDFAESILEMNKINPASK